MGELTGRKVVVPQVTFRAVGTCSVDDLAGSDQPFLSGADRWAYALPELMSVRMVAAPPGRLPSNCPIWYKAMREAPNFKDFLWTVRTDEDDALQRVLAQDMSTEFALITSNRKRSVYRLRADGLDLHVEYTCAERLRQTLQGLSRCRARREFEAAGVLENAGVNVVPHLAWGVCGPQSILITRTLKPSATLDELWREDLSSTSERDSILAAVAELVRQMLRADVCCRDFDHSNVLIVDEQDSRKTAALIDVLGASCASGAGGPGRSQAMRVAAIMAISLPQLRRAQFLRDCLPECTHEQRMTEWRQALKQFFASDHRRWRGIRRRMAGHSTLVETAREDGGRWRLAPPFALTAAREAVAMHERNMQQDLAVLKRDTKRQLSRVDPEGQSLIVKEYRCPGPWGPLRPDSRAWLNAARLRSAAVPMAELHAWLRARDGRGYQVMEDVGDRTLMEELRSSANWRWRRRLVQQAALMIGLLHAAGLSHGDLKPANFVMAEDSYGPRVRLVDYDALHVFRKRVPLARRQRAFEQFFERLHQHVTPTEILRFAAVYRTVTGDSGAAVRALLPDCCNQVLAHEETSHR